MLPNERLEEIQQRLDRATPGPWEVAEVEGWIGIHPVCPPHGTDDAAEISGGLADLSAADADLIAHAPEDIAALVAEVDRLRARDVLTTAVAEAADSYTKAESDPGVLEVHRVKAYKRLCTALDALDAGSEG